MIVVPDHGNYRTASKPRSIVLIDGNPAWFDSWTVNLNSTHHADDFTIDFPFRITKNLPQGYFINTPDFPSYLMTNSDIKVEVYAGYPADASNFSTGDLTRIMYGYVDTIDLRLGISGETVSLAGRNMIAPFLDSKTTEKYQNMTSSAIAQMFAAKHGLQAVVTTTYTLTGAYYNGDTVEINKDISEWDLLTFLAEQEGFALRVMDNTLYFGSYDTVVGSIASLDPLNYTWGQNIEDLAITRTPHAAKNLIIDVHSYDYNQGKHVRATAQRTSQRANDVYHERYYFPGYTQDQCQKKAQSILDELSRLELVGTMKVSGNEQLKVDRQIALYGVGMGLSQNYYVRKSTHTFNQTNPDGYKCDVTFSNLLMPDEQTGGL